MYEQRSSRSCRRLTVPCPFTQELTADFPCLNTFLPACLCRDSLTVVGKPSQAQPLSHKRNETADSKISPMVFRKVPRKTGCQLFMTAVHLSPYFVQDGLLPSLFHFSAASWSFLESHPKETTCSQALDSSAASGEATLRYSLLGGRHWFHPVSMAPPDIKKKKTLGWRSSVFSNQLLGLPNFQQISQSEATGEASWIHAFWMFNTWYKSSVYQCGFSFPFQNLWVTFHLPRKHTYGGT